MSRILTIGAFTGGLVKTDAMRGELLEDGQLQSCTNFESKDRGILRGRFGVTAFPDTITSAITGDIIDFWIWKPGIMPTGFTGDFLIIVYDDEDKLWLLGKDTTWKSVYLVGVTETQVFSNLEPPTIVNTSYGVALCDGRDNNILKSVEITPDGDLVFGDIGVPSPLGMAEFSTDEEDNLTTSSGTDNGMAVRKGSILFMAYTMVTRDGIESNPSPEVVFLDENKLSLDEDLNLEDYYIKATADKLRSILADMSGYEGLTERIKYFNVYMGSVPYVGGEIARGDLRLVGRMPVGDLTGDNTYVSTQPFTGASISYENDIGCKADDICDNATVTMVSNANTKEDFPFDFDWAFKITLDNKNNRNYVKRPVRFRLFDTDMVDKDGDQILYWDSDESGSLTSGSAILAANLPKLRFIAGDKTTFLPVIYSYVATNGYIDFYVPPNYVNAGDYEEFYLLYAKDSVGVPSQIGAETDFRTILYGQFVNEVDWSGQLVFQGEHPMSMKSYVCARLNENSSGTDDVLNISDENIPGELSNAEWVADDLGILPDFHESIGANCVQLTASNGNIIFSGLNIETIPSKGMIFGRYGYDPAKVILGDSVIAGIGEEGAVGSEDGLFITMDQSTGLFKIITKTNVTTDVQGMFAYPTGAAKIIFLVMSWDEDADYVSLIMVNVSVLGEGITGAKGTSVPDVSDLVCDHVFLGQPGFLSGENAIDDSLYAQWQFVAGVSLDGSLDDDKQKAWNLANYMGFYPTEQIGYHIYDTENKNVTVGAGIPIEYNSPVGMLKWSSLGGRVMPDGNYAFAAEKTRRIHPAPNYLKNGQYLNSTVIFGERYRQRFVLSGDPSGWAAQISDVLVQENEFFGLPENCKKTLLMIKDALYYLSGNKFIREDSRGQVVMNEDAGGNELLQIPYPDETIDNEYIAFYDRLTGQIIIHTQYDDGVSS
jgi:hypothetical protein